MPLPGDVDDSGTSTAVSHHRGRLVLPHSGSEIVSRKSKVIRSPAAQNDFEDELLGMSLAPFGERRIPMAEQKPSKAKPSGAEHNDKNQVPVSGQHNQQNPQLKDRK